VPANPRQLGDREQHADEIRRDPRDTAEASTREFARAIADLRRRR